MGCLGSKLFHCERKKMYAFACAFVSCVLRFRFRAIAGSQETLGVCVLILFEQSTALGHSKKRSGFLSSLPYKLLPQRMVDSTSVKEFQSAARFGRLLGLGMSVLAEGPVA